MARVRKRKNGKGDLAGGVIAIAVCIGLARNPPVGSVTEMSTGLLKTVLVWGVGGALALLAIQLTYKYYQKNKLSARPPPPPWSVSAKTNNISSESYQNRSKNIDSAPRDVSQIENSTSLTVSWSIQLIRDLSWQRLELLSSVVLGVKYRAELTGLGADEGVDIRLYDRNAVGESKPIALVQVKSRSKQKIGVAIARELKGVMAVKQVSNGVLIASAGFTDQAVAFASESRIQLIDDNRLLQMIDKLPGALQAKILTDITSGDYTHPDCPSCGTALVKRTATKGNNKGGEFWGCTNYPKCRVVINIPK
jgi:hypothetical protein